MGLSLPAINIPQPPRPPSLLRRGVEPEDLIEAGILADPDSPDGALQRARALVKRGAYREARTLLYPYARTAPAVLKPKILELLGLCAAHGNGEWRPLFEAARVAFAKLHDLQSVARIERHIGEALLERGQFHEADQHLREAGRAYTALGDIARLACVNCLRARARRYAGHMQLALEGVDKALTEIMPLGQPRAEGLLRLDRAAILAHMGEAGAVAKELICAERLLASGGSRLDRFHARLARAHTLLVLGEKKRAAAGLERLQSEVDELEDVSIRGQAHLLLGQALADIAPDSARHHLMRARHLYETVGSDFGVGRCELLLARVERGLGLNPLGRLKKLSHAPLGEWPLFAAELRMARAETISEAKPELARSLLLEARGFAVTSGNRSLAREIDVTLRTLRLVTTNELAALPILEPEPTVRTVHGGATYLPQPTGGPEQGPQRLDRERRSSIRKEVVDSALRAIRLIRNTVPGSPSLKLKAPAPVGVRRASGATR